MGGQLVSRLMLVVVLGCAGGLACDDDSATEPSAAQGTPGVVSMTPLSGPVGTTVTIRGSGFAPENNAVTFGSGYIRGLRSDGTTITFTVPEGLDLCAPDSAGPCQGAFPRVGPGDYRVAVVTQRARSESLTFTVTQ